MIPARLAVSPLPFALLACAAAADSADRVALLRDREPSARPLCLVVGAPHLDNPGRDVANLAVDDMSTARRQRQIEEVVARLAAFHPTRMAVEWPAAEQARLDQRYRDYRSGRLALSASEVDQIGLRLAARLGLERLEAVDWNQMPPGTVADFDWETWALAHGQQARLEALLDRRSVAADTARFRAATLLESLREANAPEELARAHRRYFDFALLGDEASHPGANWVANWYGRNLKIFANLVRRAPGPGERLLVLYGAGHAFLLREFAAQSGAFEVLEAGPFLAP